MGMGRHRAFHTPPVVAAPMKRCGSTFYQWGFSFSSSRAPQAALVSDVLLFCAALCAVPPFDRAGCEGPPSGAAGPLDCARGGVSTAAPRAARGNFGFWGPWGTLISGAVAAALPSFAAPTLKRHAL
jgi:hypothetical protein